MLHLLRKDAFHFGLYLLVLFPLMILYLLLSKSEVDAGFIMLQWQWVLLLTIGGAGMTEQSEDKTRGYDFMKILPVSSRMLVSAKFAMVLLVALFLVGANLALLTVVKPPPPLLSLGRTFVTAAGSLAVVLVGIMYLVRFHTDHMRAFRFGWLFFIPFFAAPIVLIELNEAGRIDLAEVLRDLSASGGTVRVISILTGMSVFYLLMRASIRARRRHTL